MMSQLNQESDANMIINEQHLKQQEQALYSYCKVMRKPKLGVAPVIITVLEGVIITLLIATLGEGLLLAVVIGGFFTALFAFLCWLVYRYRVGSSKMLNSYLAEDDGCAMFNDFASAQPFAKDQFRLGSHYLYIKNGAVIKLDSITDIVRTNAHYRMVPTGVYLTVIVKDGNSSMSYPLCSLHMLKAGAEEEEIRKAVLQRP
jgi:hypothetical protein